MMWRCPISYRPVDSAGGDRTDLGLHQEDIDIILAVAAQNDRVVVVVEAGGAVTVEPWIDEIEALVHAWYPGMEGGNAIAAVLYGEVNPSGKLPLTIPHAHDTLYEFGTMQPSVEYAYYHGYRYFDHQDLSPRFSFGFGLSYTEFTYANLVLSEPSITTQGTLQVRFDLTNTGRIAGKEVAQLYAGFPGAAVERSVRELKAFAKVHLEPGESQTVVFDLPAEELAYYDVEQSRWSVEPGLYTVEVGSSSRDLPLKGTYFIE